MSAAPALPARPDAPPERADARCCEAIVRAHARTFSLASGFLPPRKRRSAFALYAFCRVADDIVDQAHAGPPGSAAAALAAYRAEVAEAVAGRPRGPVLRELARTVAESGVPADLLAELLDGVARDLRPARYATWAELTRYCEGVASSVGAMCAHVFGVAGDATVRERAVRYARTLGVAMQLTNILRDVGEDAARGRCYLPDEDLAAFGLTAERVLHDPTLKDDPRWMDFMRHQVARARALYRAATPGIALLSPDAQRCAHACADGYAAILDVIERNHYDAFSVRAHVGTWTRAGLLWSVWRAGRTGERVAYPHEGPVIEWGTRRLTRAEDMELCA
jgi:15-cis-phytoene synthase